MGDREIVVDGRVVLVRVRESPRARTMRLDVAVGRPPEVVVPTRTRHRVVDEFLHSRQHWLAEKLAALQALAQRPGALPHRRGQVWLAGETVPVVHDPDGRSTAALRGGRLVVGGAPSEAAASVDRWYRREARRRLSETAERLAPELNVMVAAVSVRDQRTRWGSCSHSGRLSFSWRLVLAPCPVMTYVVLHELCHLREFNHSRSFWTLVESVRPDWRDAAGWLRDHGHELHSYRPERCLSIGPVTAGGTPSGTAVGSPAATVRSRDDSSRATS